MRIINRIKKAWYEAKYASGRLVLGHPVSEVVEDSVERAFGRKADPDD